MTPLRASTARWRLFGVPARKTTISSDVSESGVFTARRNGNLVGSLTISAPAADTVHDCPNGQTATLSAVMWSDVHVTDLTSGASIDL